MNNLALGKMMIVLLKMENCNICCSFSHKWLFFCLSDFVIRICHDAIYMWHYLQKQKHIQGIWVDNT